jgi:hypothetical protein
LAHIFDAVVAGAIDLDHVQAVAGGNLAAIIANAAGLNGRPVHAIKRLCQNTRCGGFADPARPNKKIGMGQTILCDRVFQRARDMRLTYQIVKSLGSIFSRKNLVAHALKSNEKVDSRKPPKLMG